MAEKEAQMRSFEFLTLPWSAKAFVKGCGFRALVYGVLLIVFAFVAGLASTEYSRAGRSAPITAFATTPAAAGNLVPAW
jgi:hypothetical protein